MKPITYGLAVLILGAFAVSCSVSGVPDVYSGDPGPDPLVGLEAIDLSDAQDGDSPEEYGYIVGNDGDGLPGFVIRDGVIESAGTAGGWLNLDSPDFTIDRSEQGGVVVNWEVRYIESLPDRSRERSKFYIKLTDADDLELYGFEYKPFLNDGDNREASLIVYGDDPGSGADDVKTSANQTDVTPSGSEAPWLSFRMELLDTGEVTVYYDYDGSGWIEMLSIVDTTYTVFQGIRFTYRTTADPQNYTIQLRNLSVLPIDS